MLLCPVLFPCGLQQKELLSQYRFRPVNEQLLNSSSELQEAASNSSEPEDERLPTATVALSNHTAGNETELMTFRMVDASLEKPGGSPWQARTCSI